VGIGLLNAALNLNHLTRVTEHLRIIDRRHLERSVTIHVSLDRLTPDQYSAAVKYGHLRDRTAGQRADERSLMSSGETAPLVWVPITRLDRSVVAPISLRDNEDREIARATQPDLLPLINAAMYVLLRLELETGPGIQDGSPARPESSLDDLLNNTNQARWLIEQAVASMLFDRSNCPVEALQMPEPSPPRQLALDVLREHLNVDKYHAFFDLLWHASNEYLVVAGLNPLKQEHHITYRAPTLPATKESATEVRWRRYLRGVCPGREFTVLYKSSLPRNLNSYHVSLEAESGVRVREAILTTNHDGPRLTELCQDLKTLADAVDQPSTPADPYLDYEISDARFRLTKLCADRAKDAHVYRRYAERRHLQDQTSESRAAWELRSVHQQASKSATAEQLCQSEQDRKDLAIGLRDLSNRAVTLQLGRDLVVDDDPRDNGAHMYWRRSAPIDGSRPASRTTATMQAVLADDPPSLSGSVVMWLGLLLLLFMLVGFLVYRNLLWFSPWTSDVRVQGDIEVEALIAVLLIVPGVILSRLGLPASHSVAGQLNYLDRLLAELAVAAAGMLGLILAVSGQENGRLHLGFRWTFYILPALFFVSIVDRLISRRRRNCVRATVIDSPAWLAPDADWSRRVSRSLRKRVRRRWVEELRAPDAAFEDLKPGTKDGDNA
jgi:hypothetical protein